MVKTKESMTSGEMIFPSHFIDSYQQIPQTHHFMYFHFSQ